MSKKKPLWTPSPERISKANFQKWYQHLAENYGLKFADYWELHNWSVREIPKFWEYLWKWSGLKFSSPPEVILENGEDMLNAKWFRGAKLNFAQNLLSRRDDSLAIIASDERGNDRTLTYAQLYDLTRNLSRALAESGVKVGDRVAGYLPNIPETVISMLATTSIGAIWSSTSPDFGYRGVLDRFGQIEPKILITADGYSYKGKEISILERLPKIVSEISSIEKVVVVPFLNEKPDISGIPKAVLWGDFAVESQGEIQFEQLPFDHPVYILYSSGTTGVPKCIVHGAGGTLLQHIKEHRLHCDLKPGDRFFYFTTCGWMMWNWLVSGLATGATIVLYDGSPFYPDGKVLWKLAEKYRIRIFGTSAKYLAALEKFGVKPREEFDLSHLDAILSTGSPLSEASFHYVYRDIKSDLHLASISGGTDLISCFVLGNPQLPVYSGEIQCPGLGMKVEAYDENGRPVRGQKGELVCTAPFPCQPVYFWNDPGKEKYRKAYFSHYPNVWRHGDFIEITENNGIIIYGRSDATLNPGGVRIGTAEIYRAIEPLPEVMDSIVVGRETPDKDVEVVLFVKLAPGYELDEELIKKLKKTIREETTPRHVPAAIYSVPDIPYTISGKKVELAVKQILHGQDVPNRDALANPEALEYFKKYAK